MQTETGNRIKGPGIFLAQFIRPVEPFNTLAGLCDWVAGLGYEAIQVPAWESPNLIDLDQAAASPAYCDDYRETVAGYGLQISELNASLAGQVMAIHPAYEIAFAPFFPKGMNDPQRVEWATEELKKTIRAAANLDTDCVPVLSGGLAWHMFYPWPQRPRGLIDEAFSELSRRWKPVLDHASENGVKIAFELHPGSDLFDGYTFERFVGMLGGHDAIAINYDPSHLVLQGMDYLEFIKLYGARISGFHVKDAELNCTGRGGVYGGYQEWSRRPGRFRSLGDGQVDFNRVFSLLTESGYRGWAVLEWECAVKSPVQGAEQGAPFIRDCIIEATHISFDDFAAGNGGDASTNRKILGLE